jgi:NAD(P)-dependent dehydrogenase (short-subunit alcohol dehydrogenase family)
MIKQKVAIVTAASKGIGAACARKMAEIGYKLVLLSRSDAIYALADELDARPLKGSLAASHDINHLVNFTYEKYGRIDSLIINTGHASKGDILELTDAEWQHGFELLLMQIIRLSRLAAPIMKEQKSGSIVNISAFGAKEPSADFPISSVIRSAVSSYTRLFATELAPYNVRMNSVLPGFVNSYPADEETINQIPMLREGKTQEIASTVAYLASDEASYITGQNIAVDGGLTRSL